MNMYNYNKSRTMSTVTGHQHVSVVLVCCCINMLMCRCVGVLAHRRVGVSARRRVGVSARRRVCVPSESSNTRYKGRGNAGSHQTPCNLAHMKEGEGKRDYSTARHYHGTALANVGHPCRCRVTLIYHSDGATSAGRREWVVW